MQWLLDPTVLWVSGIVSLLLFLLSLIIVPVIAVRIPADYFSRKADPGSGPDRSWKGLLLTVARNLLGILLIIAEIVMLVAPGPGLVTILIGLAMTDIPGKRKLLIKIVRQKQVNAWINRLRARYSKPPLEFDGDKP